MPIVLYQIPMSGPCRAVMMTAQHLGIELDMRFVDVFGGEQMKPEFLKINPQHSLPTIDDDGFILWESRTIMAYLVNKYAPDSPLYPKDPKERAVVDRMLYFDLGTLYKAQVEYLAPIMSEKRPADPDKEENFRKLLELLNGFLSKTAYVAGDHLTIADLSIASSMSFIVEVAGFDVSPYPRVSAWLQKLKEETPNYAEINDVPLNEFKEFLNSEKCKEFIEARKKKNPT